MIYETNFHEWIEADSRFHAWTKSKYPLNLVLILNKKSSIY